MQTRPCVDLCATDLAVESTLTLFGMPLFCSGIGHPALGAVEIFGRPYASGHAANMRQETKLFPALPVATTNRSLPGSRSKPNRFVNLPRGFSIPGSQQKTPAHRPGFETFEELLAQ